MITWTGYVLLRVSPGNRHDGYVAAFPTLRALVEWASSDVDVESVRVVRCDDRRRAGYNAEVPNEFWMRGAFVTREDAEEIVRKRGTIKPLVEHAVRAEMARVAWRDPNEVPEHPEFP